MRDNIELKQSIQNTLSAFVTQPLAEASLGLLRTLGYESPRGLQINPNSVDQFLTQFDTTGKMNIETACLSDWISVDFLFQLTDAEIQSVAKGMADMFVSRKVDNKDIRSYVFFSVGLKGKVYTRTQLANITREINKLFPMPAMVVFRYGEVISLAIIARRLNLRDGSKDVLEKVTLIKDVSFVNTHRAHIEILADFSLGELLRVYHFTNFVELQNAWEKTLDTSELNNRFFREYRRIFEEAEATLPARLQWPEERKRIYTQRFFNRVLFVVFLERKGWLNFNGRRDYLRALFEDYWKHDHDKRTEANFHRKRLNTLFFMGLNHPSGDKRRDPGYRPILSQIGDVPYLNGGLFDEEEDDRDGPLFPDLIIAKILNDLVYRFVFTVTESTPLNVEVAVDPEMLGHIFEELVTGRHESGSYYTPKPVVAFMCREALKAYLETTLPSETQEALSLFVDKNDVAGLKNPERTLNALRAVKVCDPACGSGAYLLGMLHELLEQRECLFAVSRLDATTTYDRKLEIIQNNLYGVDKDVFAVNIARLRLWLSLVVDYEGAVPPPLPNLDFKIESGDSLTAPDPSGGLQPDMFRYAQVQEFLGLKNEFMDLHAGSEKKKKLGEEIAELKKKIEEWAHPKGYDKEANSFDWQVDFAEVFAPELAQSTLGGKMTGIINSAGGQLEMTEMPSEGGFDIVLANPPYVRMELFKDIKPTLKKIYADVHDERADLYIYFYSRTHQILRPGGVACIISSNKWLRAGYGEKLRQLLLDDQEFRLVVDFGELPIFQTAATFPAIFLWKKEARKETGTKWAVVKNLHECYEEGILEHVERIGEVIPAKNFIKGNTRLTSSKNTDFRLTLEKNGIRLGYLINNNFLYGIKSGLNEAFYVDENQRNKLIQEDKKSREVLKPLLKGDDVRGYEIQYRGLYILYMYHGVKIENYPAIKSHLKKFRSVLEQRATQQEWYELQQPSIAYVQHWEKTKIIFPEIAKEQRFVMDENLHYPDKTVFSIPSDDWYLLGVLNSSSAWQYLKLICSVLGDEDSGGRLTLQAIFLERLPIPEAPKKECEAVAKLAKQAQNLHMQRRRCVEQFLREIGVKLFDSTSRNPLEIPWSLTEDDFIRRVGRDGISIYQKVREETMYLTEEIAHVEREIDAQVKALYGLI